MRRSLTAALVSAALLVSPAAGAFCGFYVGGGGAQLFNNATQVALMREGTRTVLSMANNYQGPPADFALVVPVPVILKKENVKTLTPALFEHLDLLSAPRLVEYWEQDPCMGERFGLGGMATKSAPMADLAAPASPRGAARPSVRVEAQFAVGEYDIVILSADDSMGLDTWLRENRYNIPAGAEPHLRPYVAAGMKFFVAKVDIAKVKKDGDKTMLSPLRFHYDSDLFSLPVRLGLVNSAGVQDLIVYVLARGQRYEVANYANVAVPTNLNVKNTVKTQFGSFYASLFDLTTKQHPGSVVTEYSWDASSCDPCPGPALSSSDLAVLGEDVIAPPSSAAVVPPGRGRRGTVRNGSFVLTRLHARYGKDSLGEDLVFREAAPIAGGREFGGDDDGKLEQGASPAQTNTFQGRYAIRYPWMGAIACKNPQRGIWGGPPDDRNDEPLKPATGLSFVTRRGIDPFPLIKTSAPVRASLLGAAAKVPTTISSGIPFAAPAPSASVSQVELTPPPAASEAPDAPTVAPVPPPRGGCGGCQAAPSDASLPAALGLLAAWLGRARRKVRR